MKQHLAYIDIFKGFAIILVVVGHIIQFNNLDGGINNDIYHWIYTFHMSLFFFISGFLSGNMTFDMKLSHRLLKKIKRLLLPFISWGFINYVVCEHSHLSLNGFFVYVILIPQMGLWFLKDLFIISIVIITLLYILSLRHLKSIYLNILMSLILILFVVIGKWFYAVYIIGYFTRKYGLDIIGNRILSTASFLLFIALSYFDYLPSRVISLLAIIVFYNISMYSNMSCYARKYLSILGRNSMPIFILHFFIVMNNGLSFINPILSENQMFNFSLLTILSLIVSSICLCLYQISDYGYLLPILWGNSLKK